MEDVFTQESVSPRLEKQLVDCVVQGSQETLGISKLANALVCVYSVMHACGLWHNGCITTTAFIIEICACIERHLYIILVMFVYILCKSHAEAHFRFLSSAYSVCEHQRRSVPVRLETTGVLDQRVLVDIRVIGGTAAGKKNDRSLNK